MDESIFRMEDRFMEIIINDEVALAETYYGLYEDAQFDFVKKILQFINILKSKHKEEKDKMYAEYKDSIWEYMKEIGEWKRRYENVRNEYAPETILMNTNKTLSYKIVELENEIRKLKGE